MPARSLRRAAKIGIAGSGEKNAARMRGVLLRLETVLLRNRPLEHPVDLLVGRIAAGLARMRRRQRLVGRALRTAGRLAGRLGSAVGLISLALGSRDVALRLSQLRLQIRNLCLQRLEIRTGGQANGQR